VVKIGHVVEEADESCYWLEVIRASQIASAPDLERLRREFVNRQASITL
jgi:hypothetical protein